MITFSALLALKCGFQLITALHNDLYPWLGKQVSRSLALRRCVRSPLNEYSFCFVFPLDQCKNFNEWFSNVKMNLKDCFESSETKKSVEQKLQKLSVRHI